MWSSRLVSLPCNGPKTAQELFEKDLRYSFVLIVVKCIVASWTGPLIEAKIRLFLLNHVKL